MEVWGGIECTVNRVGPRYFDQVARTGHEQRLEDLDRFADLGITAIRYPLLWERMASEGSDVEFAWADERLGRLREIGIRPIAGLLHHGSGPRETNLLDPDFARRFAEYARALAERYPWILEWTPINEPVTTARFSGLYGHWYPHGRALHLFVRALLNQCRAIVLAMREIRQINPQARLITTDDYGRSSSTPALAYQAIYQNQRR